jgi:argininosuccinate lyase
MTRLWDKGDPLDAAILRLTVGRDPELDLLLVPWDCEASLAHATMLETIGVLSAAELEEIRHELRDIAGDALSGELVIDLADEDGHTAIENRLTARLGEAGRKIHTGRSRNDQVIAALRLWGRRAALEQIESVAKVTGRLLDLADQHRDTTIPGYTHTRQAMPTTLGHLFAAWAENLLDDIPWLELAFRHLDRSPLGSASGFGIGLPLDREMVSDLLSFDRLQVNTLAVQNDRGKSEYLALSAAAATATDLGRLASDLIWYSSDELGYLGLSSNVTTGSSIMPQKRNPDVLELLRARAARLRSQQGEVGAIYGTLPAGYHRDLQLTKEPFLEGMTSLVDMATALAPVLDGLTVDVERCRRAVLPATGATDALYRRLDGGEAFRDAYRSQARDLESGGARSDSWRDRIHEGAPGNLDLDLQRRLLSEVRDRLESRRARTTPGLFPVDDAS